MPSITELAAAELDKQLADLPSTGKGVAHITLANAGARVDLAARWSPHISSAAFWQKAPKQAATWGTRTTIRW